MDCSSLAVGGCHLIENDESAGGDKFIRENRDFPDNSIREVISKYLVEDGNQCKRGL